MECAKHAVKVSHESIKMNTYFNKKLCPDVLNSKDEWLTLNFLFLFLFQTHDLNL